MDLVFQFDPAEHIPEKEPELSPFRKLWDYYEEDPFSFGDNQSVNNFDNFSEVAGERSIRVINSFNNIKRRKLEEEPCNSATGEVYTHDHTKNTLLGEQVDVDNKGKHFPNLEGNDTECVLSGLQNNSESGLKPQLNSTKNIDQRSRPLRKRKRKNIVVKRDKYKKRKDVLMKGVLRRFRKFYQEKYINFNRAKFLENSENPQQTSDSEIDFPDTLMEETSKQLTLENLINFSSEEVAQSKHYKDLFLYVGSLIFPEEFKWANIANAARLGESQKYNDVATLVHEVLYKFSYQKLNVFLSIPQVAYLYCRFSETVGQWSDIDQKAAQTILEQCKKTLLD